MSNYNGNISDALSEWSQYNKVSTGATFIYFSLISPITRRNSIHTWLTFNNKMYISFAVQPISRRICSVNMREQRKKAEKVILIATGIRNGRLAWPHGCRICLHERCSRNSSSSRFTGIRSENASRHREERNTYRI